MTKYMLICFICICGSLLLTIAMCSKLSDRVYVLEKLVLKQHETIEQLTIEQRHTAYDMSEYFYKIGWPQASQD